MGQPKPAPDAAIPARRFPRGVLGNPQPIAQRFAHVQAPRADPLRADPVEPPRKPAVPPAPMPATAGRPRLRTYLLLAALALAAIVPSVVLGAMWLAQGDAMDSTEAAPPPQANTIVPSAVLTAPDKVEAVAGSTVPFPIALDGTDGMPPRSLIAVKGLPQGGDFSEGRPFGEGEWTLRPDQIGDLHLAVPPGASGQFKLAIALLGPDDATIAAAETLLEIAPAPAPAEPMAVMAAAAASPGEGEVAPTTSEAVAALPPTPDADAPAAETEEQPAAAEVAAADPAAAPAQTADQVSGSESAKETVEPSVYVNMREGPSSSAAVIGVIAKGTKLAVLDRKRGWVNVTDPGSGKSGWIYRGLIAGEAPANTRVRRVAPPDPEPKSESFWGRVGRWLTPD
jgi:hypothetical protein